jgi:TRAP-type transport system periplasmic protein
MTVTQMLFMSRSRIAICLLSCCIILSLGLATTVRAADPIALTPIALTPIPLTIVSFSAPDSAHGRRWQRFEQKVEETLGGQVALTMLTGGQIGNEENMLSSLRRGRAQMGIISIGALAALVPELSLLTAPFLFESEAEADFIMDRYLFAPYAALLAEKGLTLAKWEDGGWHQLYARKPLPTPTDLINYRLRSSATEATRLFLAEAGADVVVLDFGDMVAAQQTGLVDGGVTTSVMYRVAGLYEDAPHFTLTRHAFAPGALLANKAWADAMPPEILDAVLAAQGTVADNRRLVRREAEESEDQLRAAGAILHELTEEERRAWITVAAPVQRKLREDIGGEAERFYELVLEGKRAFARLVAPPAE